MSPYIFTNIDAASFLLYWPEIPEQPVTLSVLTDSGWDDERTLEPTRYSHITTAPGGTVVTVKVDGVPPVHATFGKPRTLLNISVGAETPLLIEGGSLLIGTKRDGTIVCYRNCVSTPTEIAACGCATIQVEANLPSIDAILHYAGEFTGSSPECSFENACATTHNVEVTGHEGPTYPLTAAAIQADGYLTPAS